MVSILSTQPRYTGATAMPRSIVAQRMMYLCGTDGATVHRVVGAGDLAGEVRGEENEHRSHILRGAHALRRKLAHVFDKMLDGRLSVQAVRLSQVIGEPSMLVPLCSIRRAG